MKEENFEHFGIEFNSNEIKKYLNRENFAIINTACENNECIRYRREHWDYFEKIRDNINIDDYSINIWPPSYKYCMEDGTLRLSDEFCKKYQEACLMVYDANIDFFKKLNKRDFIEKIDNILYENREYIKITNLNEYKGKSGIYIMILDEYKQIYVGQSKDIRRRILTHWKREPRFDSLIFPNIEKSNIQIDSFGVLDTTRIYVKEEAMKTMYSLDKEEKRIVEKIPKEYLINRIGGGIRLNSLEKIIDTINFRKLKI